MWLINTKTLELESFPNTPDKYAILSHTWEDGEVSFQDVRGLPGGNLRYRDQQGWRKIESCCKVAREENYGYVWIDTCCIDKSSSAELQEAINSMWKWYRDSSICLVYLCDFSLSVDYVSGWTEPAIDETKFTRCRWFTRGWTLQELLAPQTIVFYTENWTAIGTKSSLENLISLATGIHVYHLQNRWSASIAAKMSWASMRLTTRQEDMAYSLMGLFNVNMPLLYGEGGSGAFRRLQLEILQQSDDESIFAWGNAKYVGNTDMQWDPWVDVLADHPRAFCGSQNVLSTNTLLRPPYFATNKGIQITCQLIPAESDMSLSSDYFLVPLDCTLRTGFNTQLLAIPLTNIRTLTPGIDIYKRSGPLRELNEHQMKSLQTLEFRRVYFGSFTYFEIDKPHL